MQKILVMRFSAMGDVALCLPVVKNILANNTQTEIIFVTKKPFDNFFNHIDRLKVIGIDFNKKYNGILGLHKLKNDLLQQYEFDTVIDLHDVLRTKILRAYFKLKGKKIVTFEKARDEKENAVKTKSKEELRHTSQRYFDAFENCGLKIETQFSYPNIITPSSPNLVSFFENNKRTNNIGFAPFAKHETKTYPFELSKQLIQKTHLNTAVYLFGGKEDSEKINSLCENFENCVSTLTLSLIEQIELMSKLNVFVSMDSSNMHLAALQGIPVISIWGATLPHLGFNAIDTLPQNNICTSNILACQPCSVFGNKPCSNKQFPYECFYTIDQQAIIDRIAHYCS